MEQANASGMLIDLTMGGLLLLVAGAALVFQVVGKLSWLEKGRGVYWLCCIELLVVTGWLLVPAGALFAPWVLLGMATLLTLRKILESDLFRWVLARASSHSVNFAGLVAAALTLVFGPGILDAWELDRQARDAEERAGFEVPPPKLSESRQTFGITASGQTIPLFAADCESEQPLDEEQWLQRGDWDYRVIRLADAHPDSNCHGHVFGHGRHWVLGRHVDTILRDNQYAQVEVPAENDVAVYRNLDGTVTHTGVVRGHLPDGSPLVEGKWGSMGVYLHPAEICPYGRDLITFHRHPEKTSHHLDLGMR